MADFTIEAQPREITGKKVKQLRNEGLVPVTVYGPKREPVNLQVPYRPLEVALMKAGGTNLIEIVADGKKVTTLAREVQRDPIKRTIKHVDFFAVDLKAKIRVDVPLQFVGESRPVETKQGTLVYGAQNITVEVLPGDLIHSIEVDLSKLSTLGAAIHVSDLDLGSTVTIINDPDEMIVSVHQTSASMSAEGGEEGEEETSSSEPEVITRGKQEDEDF